MRVGTDILQIFRRDGRREREADNTGRADEEGPGLVKYKWHQRAIDEFIESVQQGHEPMVSGRAALAPHRLIAAIESSSRSGAAVDLVVN